MVNKIPPALIFLGLFSPSCVFFLLGFIEASAIVFVGGFVSFLLITYAPEIRSNQRAMAFLRKWL
jgi:Zn-dependent membrane protease YugP